MRSNQLFAGCVVVFAYAASANGHGTPIHVEVVENRLVVSQGLPDEGFVSMIYFEDDEDGEPFGAQTFPNVGSVVLWQIPGLDIFGMDDQSNLSIEVLLRPVQDSDPVEQRLVWYWNPQTELVESSPSAFHLLGGTTDYTSLPGGETTTSPPPLLVADPIAGEQGFHNHSLLFYGLDNDPVAPAGAYGLFARLTSNQYDSSDPFLVVFNHGVAYEQMLTAALAINTAAGDVDDLPGDFNLDGKVDAADYTVWRDTLGDEPSYHLWTANFGSVAGTAVPIRSTAVPEPGASPTVAILIFCLIGRLAARHAAARRNPHAKLLPQTFATYAITNNRGGYGLPDSSMNGLQRGVRGLEPARGG